MDFHTYIKAVGTGPKGNRDLSVQESEDMMRQMLSNDVYSEQIAAFLLGWRLKPETVEEFQGALVGCDAFITHAKVDNSIELGYPFDGKAKTPYLFPLIAEVVQKEALNLVVMSDDLTPAKNGITIKSLQESFILSKNVHYFDRKNYSKALHDLTQVRQRIGVRTGLNTIEKLPGVAQSDSAITGVFHKPYVKKYMQMYQERYKNFALIQGSEGGPELFKKGSLWLARDGEVSEHSVDPERYGIASMHFEDRTTADVMLDILKNPSKEYTQIAQLNGAILLFIANKANSLDEAYEMVRTQG